MVEHVGVACPFCGWRGLRDRKRLEREKLVACESCRALISGPNRKWPPKSLKNMANILCGFGARNKKGAGLDASRPLPFRRSRAEGSPYGKGAQPLRDGLALAIAAFVTLALTGSALTAARLRNVPLPPPRPLDLGAVVAPLTSPRPSHPQSTNSTCSGLAASGHVVGQVIAPVVGPGACGISSPMRLEAIVLDDGSQVALSAPIVMRCSLAASVADWVRDDLAPAVAAEGDRLVKIDGVGAYECRTRDHLAGAKLSEHAKGNAMDLHALVTLRGKTDTVAPSAGAEAEGRRALMMQMKSSACRRFTTVLGPGSDSFHAEHLHVDLEERRNRFRICQWTLP